MKKSLKFIAIYAAQVGAIWGLLEAYSYFKGDALKDFLGQFWILIYIIPLLTTAFLVARGNGNENAVQESITTQGDFSPGKVGGNYNVQMPSADNPQTESPNKSPAETRKAASSEEANQNIRTKGNYSPGKVEGDYKIDG
jgi:hypothetical protein